MKKLLILFVAVFCLIHSMVLFASDLIRIAHSDSIHHPKHKAFVRFSELIEKRTAGAVEVKIYPSGQLGDEREIIESLQLGVVQITAVSNGAASAFSKHFMLLDIPYLFDSIERARHVLNQEAKDIVFSDIKKLGFVGLAFWEQGFRVVSTSKKPIRQASDIKGLKLRTMEAPLHVALWRSAGANPTPMSWSQVFPSLQQGVIDGQENPIYILTQEKLSEIQAYVYLTRHIYDSMPVITNKKWFDSLKPEIRSIVKESIDEITVYQQQLVDEMTAVAAHDLTEKGVVLIEPSMEDLLLLKTLTQSAALEIIKGELGERVVNRWLNAINVPLVQ